MKKHLNNEMRSARLGTIKRYREKSTLNNPVHAFTMSICAKMNATHTASTYNDITLTVYQSSSRKPANMTDVITSYARVPALSNCRSVTCGA